MCLILVGISMARDDGTWYTGTRGSLDNKFTYHNLNKMVDVLQTIFQKRFCWNACFILSWTLWTLVLKVLINKTSTLGQVMARRRKGDEVFTGTREGLIYWRYMLLLCFYGWTYFQLNHLINYKCSVTERKVIINLIRHLWYKWYEKLHT